MQKKILSMILAIAMVVSMFAGIAISANAAAYAKVSDDVIADGEYVLILNHQDVDYAVSAYISTKWLPKTTEGFTLTDSVSTEEAALTWEIACVDATNGYYTIKNKSDNKFLKWTANTNAIAQADSADEKCYWTIAKNDNGKFVIFSTDASVGLANNGTSGLRAYKATTITSNKYSHEFDLYKLSASACTHADATSEVLTAATCTEPGAIVWRCTCGATWTESVDALGHADATSEVLTAATCTEPGAIVWRCPCGVTWTEPVDALGHNYENGFCTVCGEAEPAAARYELLTNASKLAEGDKFIIVGAKGDVYYAMSTEQKSNNRGQIEVAVAEDGTITEIEGVQVITLGGAEGAWTLGVTDGVLTATNTTSSNYLRTVAEADQYCYFSIAIDSETGAATITAINKTSRNLMRYNSTSSCFACYTSGQNDLYIYRLVDENACQHEWSDWTVDTVATCTTDGSQSRTCGICNETETQAIPATGHTYTYVDNGTTVDATCACGDTKSITLNTIAEAKADTEGTAVYNIKGVVTYVSATEYYIQDETGAICVYFGYNVTMPEVALGDMLLVSDTITTYNGLIETSYTTAEDVVILSAENELPLAEVTIADLLADTTNEYLGERVIIKDLTIGVINPADITSLTDANGNTINMYQATGLAENVSENDTVNVTAIVSTKNGYQLRVNPGTAANDVVVTAEGEETVVTVSTIAEAKAGAAGEYFLVEGVVTFIDGRNVTIQDETAGLNVYLKANAANTVIGDKVRVYGTISTYNGLIQFSGIDETNAEFYSIISSDNTVAAQTVTLSDLAADTTNEYLSEKVAINGLTITAYASKNNVYTLTDGTAEITIFKGPKDAEGNALAVGTKLNIIEAIVSTYNGYQLRVADLSKLEITGTCAHETTELKDAVAADCTTNGYTGDTVCTLCGAVVVEGTVIEAPGHNYVDGTCEECGEAAPVPVNYSGVYYIYAVRNADGSPYFHMSNALTTGSTKRYQAVDTASTELPTEITEAIEDYVFYINANEDGTYTIHDGISRYLTWNSGNSGAFSDTAMNVTIEAGEKEGTVRISFQGDAQRFLSLNATAGTNYFAWYKSGQIADLALVPVNGDIHFHTWNETERVEASCTDAGSVTYACTCGKSYTETIEALGHSDVLIDNGDGTHSLVCCVCNVANGEPAEHTFVDGACECGAKEVTEPVYVPDSTLAFNMGITVGAEMQVVYTVVAAKVKGFESFYLEVTKNVAGGEPVVTTYGFGEGMTEFVTLTNATGAVAGYRATFTGINAKEMGDDFSAVLYAVAADGTIHYSNATTSSIKTFLMGKLTATNSSDVLRTFAVDMLNYGAAAQVNFGYDVENLVNADLTEEQKALGTQELPTAVDYSSQVGSGLKMNTAVTVKSKVTLVVTCMYAPADASNVHFVIKDTKGNILADLAPSNVIAGRAVQGTYDNVGAKEMRNLITIEVYDGDTLVSQTLTWSVESYVASMLAKTTTTENQRNMVNAMLIYGDSAAAYLG